MADYNARRDFFATLATCLALVPALALAWVTIAAVREGGGFISIVWSIL